MICKQLKKHVNTIVLKETFDTRILLRPIHLPFSMHNMQQITTVANEDEKERTSGTATLYTGLHKIFVYVVSL